MFLPRFSSVGEFGLLLAVPERDVKKKGLSLSPEDGRAEAATNTVNCLGNMAERGHLKVPWRFQSSEGLGLGNRFLFTESNP